MRAFIWHCPTSPGRVRGQGIASEVECVQYHSGEVPPDAWEYQEEQKSRQEQKSSKTVGSQTVSLVLGSELHVLYKEDTRCYNSVVPYILMELTRLWISENGAEHRISFHYSQAMMQLIFVSKKPKELLMLVTPSYEIPGHPKQF